MMAKREMGKQAGWTWMMWVGSLVLGLMVGAPLGWCATAAQTAALASLGEEELYAQMENNRLSGQLDQEQNVAKVLLARFPQGPYAPKAKYRLALTGLHSAVNWQKSVQGLLAVEEAYPGTPFAEYARRLHAALTAPKTALDVELVVEQYRVMMRASLGETLGSVMVDPDLPNGLKAQVGGSMRSAAPGHPVALAFTIQKLLRFHDQLPLIEWIETEGGLSAPEKAALAYDIAEMMYMAPQKDRYADSRSVCQWVVEHYPEQRRGCGQALRLLAELAMRVDGDLAKGEEYLRRLGQTHDASEGFCALAQYWFVRGDYVKTRAVLDETRARWSESRWALEAWRILRRREMLEMGLGAPAASPFEQQWAEVLGTPLDAAQTQAIAVGDGAGAPSVAPPAANAVAAGGGEFIAPDDCGPYAFYLACQRLSVPCSLGEAYERCPVTAGGASSFFQLYRAFLEKGLAVEALEISQEQLQELAGDGAAAVVLHLPGHFKVLVGPAADGGVTLTDADGSAPMSRERLGLYWDGYVLVVRRSTAGEAEARQFAEAAGYFEQLTRDLTAQGYQVQSRLATVEELAALAGEAECSVILNLPRHFPVLRLPGPGAAAGDGASSASLEIEQLGSLPEGEALVVRHEAGAPAVADLDAATSASQGSFLAELGAVVERGLSVRDDQLQALVARGNAGLILHNPRWMGVLEGIEAGQANLSDGSGTVFKLSIERLRVLWDGQVLVVRGGPAKP